MNAIEKMGYRINYEVLNRNYIEATGEPVNEECRRWHDNITHLFIAVYQAGVKGKPLHDVLPFVEEI
mgnify:CR=1 FL=1